METNDKCRVFVDDDTPECGKPAVGTVRIKGRVTQALVPVCAEHKAAHNEGFAKLRTASR